MVTDPNEIAALLQSREIQFVRIPVDLTGADGAYLMGADGAYLSGAA